MATDDEVRARLERLEAEVKRDAEVKLEADRRREAEAIAARDARRSARDDGQRALVRSSPARPRRDRDEIDLGDALVLARKAADAKQELARPRQAGEKSWLISGGLSFVLGPLGWLYAGAWREAVPASLFYLLAAGIAGKILPMFLLMPVLMVVLPLSAIGGVVYALGYNRGQQRVRLFGEDTGDRADRRIGRLGRGDDDA